MKKMISGFGAVALAVSDPRSLRGLRLQPTIISR